MQDMETQFVELPPEPDDVRRRIREWLDTNQKTPSDLARATNVPQPTIHRILSGESKDPRRATVDKLLRYIKTGAEAPRVTMFGPGIVRVRHIDSVLEGTTPQAPNSPHGRTLVGVLEIKRAWLEHVAPATDATNLVWGHPGISADTPNLKLQPDDVMLIDCGQRNASERSGIYALQLKSYRAEITYAHFTSSLSDPDTVRLTMSDGAMETLSRSSALNFDIVGRVIYIWRGQIV